MHKRGCQPSKQLAYNESETNKNTKALIHLITIPKLSQDSILLETERDLRSDLILLCLL